MSTFLGALLGALLRGNQGIPTLANREERQHAETRAANAMHHAETRAENASQFDEMKELLAGLRPPADLALAESSDQEAPADPEHARLAARIDSARELFNDGNITSARKLLEQVRRSAGDIPDDQEFRLLTLLGACALAAEDLPVGCAFLDQAHHLQPDNPAGLANAAQAARLREDPREAIALSRRSLELKPRDPHAAAVLIESLWDAGETEQLDEFVAAEDWTVDDRQCALTLALIRTDQHRFDDALELSRRLVEDGPEDYDARLVLAGCLLAAAQVGHGSDIIAWSRQAEDEATRALELLKSTELQARRLQALSIRAGARLFIGDSTTAMNDIDAVLLKRPEDSGSFYNKGLIFLEIDHFAEARAAFDRILDPEMRARALLPHAAACHWSGDAAAASELLRGAFSLERATSTTSARQNCSARWRDLLVAKTRSSPYSSRPWDNGVTTHGLLGLAAMHREIRGEHDAADQLLLKAVELSTNSDRRELVWRLANFYGRLERFQKAADLYIDVVDGDVLHGAAISLLVSLRNSGRLGEALGWARTIREQHPRPPKLALATEAEILNHVGDVSAAAGRWADICSRDDATMVDRTKRAQALLWSGEREAALEAIREIDASSLRGDPQQLLSLAQLKRLLGRIRLSGRRVHGTSPRAGRPVGPPGATSRCS